MISSLLLESMGDGEFFEVWLTCAYLCLYSVAECLELYRMEAPRSRAFILEAVLFPLKHVPPASWLTISSFSLVQGHPMISQKVFVVSMDSIKETSDPVKPPSYRRRLRLDVVYRNFLLKEPTPAWAYKIALTRLLDHLLGLLGMLFASG